jgi:hypothetical protein
MAISEDSTCNLDNIILERKQSFIIFDMAVMHLWPGTFDAYDQELGLS